MIDPEPTEDDEELSDFDRLMRGLVGVDPAELEDDDEQGETEPGE